MLALATPHTEPANVERLPVGDRAFSELYRAEVGRVHRRLLALTGPGAHLEDLVQKTFLEVYRSLPRFRGECRLSTWITRITINVASQHRRGVRRRPLELGLDDQDERLSQPADQDRHAELVRAVEQLDKLPDRLRIPLILREVEGLTLEEIAAAVGCSISTASARVERARSKIIKNLQKRRRRA